MKLLQTYFEGLKSIILLYGNLYLLDQILKHVGILEMKNEENLSSPMNMLLRSFQKGFSNLYYMPQSLGVWGPSCSVYILRRS